MADSLLTPVWQDPRAPWNAATAGHLLRRAGFGGTLEEVDALVRLGPEKSVATVVHFALTPDTLAGVEFGDMTAPDKGSVPGMRPRQFAQRLTEDQRRAFNQLQNAAQRAKEEEIRLWWIDRMVRSRRPLEEKMTLFWHGLFVSSAQTVRNSYLLYKQNQLFRKFATGNYRELALEVSRDPAMLIYLNNNQNIKAHPNENYARELMELFTMGIGNYTENDIKESARSFTGWTNFGDQFVFRAPQHDAGIKTFLGQTGNFNGDDIVRIIFEHPATPRYLATRLLRFFGVDEPSTDIVAALAAVVKANDFEVAPTLQTLFGSRWFYSEEVVLRQIKSPVQLVVGALRSLGVSLTQPGAVVNALRLMGQDLFNAPTVKGWDGGRAWINTSTLFARYNLPAYLGTGRLPTVSKQPPPPPPAAASTTMAKEPRAQFAEFDSGWNPQVDLAEAGVSTTDGVVDLYLRKLLGFPLDPHKRDDLIEYLNGTGDARSHMHDPVTMESERRVRGLVHLIMAMAEYQLC